MNERIRSILEQLEQTREDLLALSDDIWLSIDHNDNQVLSEFLAFKKSYNDKMSAFDQLAVELSVLVQQFTSVKLVASTSADDMPEPERKQKILTLERHPTIHLDETFTYRRPFGLRLGDEVHSKIRTWRGIYETLCLILARRDPNRFSALPEDPRFTSSHGNRYFTRDRHELRSAMALPHDLYAEINLSANNIRDQIAALLDAFGIARTDLSLYLTQGPDAGTGIG